MDPIFEQIVTDLRTKFEAAKTAQTNVAPLQTAADAANAALVDGRAQVTSTMAAADAALKQLEDYVDNGTVPTGPGGGGDTTPGGGGGDTIPAGGGTDTPPGGSGTPNTSRAPVQTARRR